MSDEWGPWIEHDGRGCPCVGMWVHRIYDRVAVDVSDGVLKNEKIGRVKNAASKSWFWTRRYARVIRYRIRKPRGLTILENLIADLPAPVRPEVDA